MSNREPGEGVLTRAMRVLGCFTEDEPALTAAQLAERIPLALSTAHRLIAEMVQHGLLVRTARYRYAVGSRLWELGELAPLSLALREPALPHMQRLYEATGENVHLAVLDGPTPQTSSALFVGRVTGQGSIPTLSRMGGRQPLHTTGVGKALLSLQDDPWLDAFFSVPLETETRYSVTDAEVLREELRRAKARGYATTREEMTLGNISVASPLGRVEGLPPTAIGLVVRLSRADERQLGPLVAQSARDLTRVLQEHAKSAY